MSGTFVPAQDSSTIELSFFLEDIEDEAMARVCYVWASPTQSRLPEISESVYKIRYQFFYCLGFISEVFLACCYYDSNNGILSSQDGAITKDGDWRLTPSTIPIIKYCKSLTPNTGTVIINATQNGAIFAQNTIYNYFILI